MTSPVSATRSGSVKGVGSRRGTGQQTITGTTGPGRVVRPRPPRPELNGLTACFIWTFWGDTDLETMGQETMRLKKAMEGYDFKVLMKHNHTPSWIDLSEADERRADVVMPPTPANFTSQLVELAQAGYAIDIYVNSHGLNGQFAASGGTHSAPTTRITEQMIRDLPAEAGLRSLPIRMVYQTQCYAASLNSAWRAAGAKVSTGARSVQFYPVQFGRFADSWDDNLTVRSANSTAVSAASRTLCEAFILLDAIGERAAGLWGGCPFTKTVLGSNPCAREYFDAKWFDPGEWRVGLSGKQNMNWASGMITAGARNARKNSLNLAW